MPKAQQQRADKKRKIDEPALASAELALATEFPDHDWFAVDALADLVQALDTDINAGSSFPSPPERVVADTPAPNADALVWNRS